MNFDITFLKGDFIVVRICKNLCMNRNHAIGKECCKFLTFCRRCGTEKVRVLAKCQFTAVKYVLQLLPRSVIITLEKQALFAEPIAEFKGDMLYPSRFPPFFLGYSTGCLFWTKPVIHFTMRFLFHLLLGHIIQDVNQVIIWISHHILWALYTR